MLARPTPRECIEALKARCVRPEQLSGISRRSGLRVLILMFPGVVLWSMLRQVLGMLWSWGPKQPPCFRNEETSYMFRKTTVDQNSQKQMYMRTFVGRAVGKQRTPIG